jgi:hypothetical protein
MAASDKSSPASGKATQRARSTPAAKAKEPPKAKKPEASSKAKPPTPAKKNVARAQEQATDKFDSKQGAAAESGASKNEGPVPASAQQPPRPAQTSVPGGGTRESAVPAQSGQPPPNGTTGPPSNGVGPAPNALGTLNSSTLSRAEQVFRQEGTILGAANATEFSQNKLNITLGRVESGEWEPEEFNRYVAGLDQWNQFSPEDSRAIYDEQLKYYTQQGQGNATQLAEADVTQARNFLISGGGQLGPSDLVQRYSSLRELDLDAIRDAFGDDPLLTPDLREPVGEQVVSQAQLAVLKGVASPADIASDVRGQLEVNKFTLPMRESFRQTVLKGFGNTPNATALTERRLEQSLGIIRATEGSVGATDIMAFAEAGFFNTRAGQMGFTGNLTPLGYANDYSLWVPVGKPPMGNETMVFALDAVEGTHALGVLSPAGEFYNLRGQFNGPTSDKFAPLPNIAGTEIPSGVYEKSNPENTFKYSEEEQKKLIERAAAQGLPGKLTFKALVNGTLVNQSYNYDDLMAKLKGDPAGFDAAADRLMYSIGLNENVIVNSRLGTPIETINGEQFRQKYLQLDYADKAMGDLLKEQKPGNIIDQLMADASPGINGFFKSVDLALGQAPSGLAKMVAANGTYLTESDDPFLKGLATAGQLVENFTMTQWMQDLLHNRERTWSSWDVFDTGVQAIMWMGPALLGKFLGVNMRAARTVSNDVFDFKKKMGSVLKLNVKPFYPATTVLKKMAGSSAGQSLLRNPALHTLGSKAVMPVAQRFDNFVDKPVHITDKWGAGTEVQRSLNKVLGDPGKEVTNTMADRMKDNFWGPIFANGWEKGNETIHQLAKIMHTRPIIEDVAMAIDQRVAPRARFIGKARPATGGADDSTKVADEVAPEGLGKEVAKPETMMGETKEVAKGVKDGKPPVEKGVDERGKPIDGLKPGTEHVERSRGIGETFTTDEEIAQILRMVGHKVVTWNTESAAITQTMKAGGKDPIRTIQQNPPSKIEPRPPKTKIPGESFSRDWLSNRALDAWLYWNRNFRKSNGFFKSGSKDSTNGKIPFGGSHLGDEFADGASKEASVPMPENGIWEWGGRRMEGFRDWAKRQWAPIDQRTAESQYQWVRRAAKTIPQSYAIGVGIMGAFQVADNAFSGRNVFDRKNYRLKEMALAGGLSAGYSIFSRNMLVPFMERLPIHIKERVEPYYPVIAQKHPERFKRDENNGFIFDSNGNLQLKQRIDLSGHDPALPWYKGNWNEHMNKEIGIQANIAGGLFTLGQYGHDPYSNGMKLAGPLSIGLERYFKAFRYASGYSLAKSYHLGDWIQRNLRHVSRSEAAEKGISPRTGIPLAGSFASLLKWAKRPPGQRIGESKKDFKERMHNPEEKKKYHEELLKYGDAHKFWAFGPNYVLMANVGVDLQHFGMPALGALPEEERKKQEELEEARKDLLEEQLRRRGDIEGGNVRLFPPILSPNIVR